MESVLEKNMGRGREARQEVMTLVQWERTEAGIGQWWWRWKEV